MAAGVASTAGLYICMLRDELKCMGQVDAELKTGRRYGANPIGSCMRQRQLLESIFLKKEHFKTHMLTQSHLAAIAFLCLCQCQTVYGVRCTPWRRPTIREPAPVRGSGLEPADLL